MMETLALLAAALLFGGMVLYAFGFAAFLFTALPMDLARSTLRRAFPHFYLFVMIASALAAALAWPNDRVSALWLAAIALSTWPTRQILMPAINEATDAGAKKRFQWLHGLSVVISLGHIGIAALVLARFV
jgi:hypothetical protein